MRPIWRRTILRLVGAGASVSLGGCLDSLDVDTGDDGDPSDGGEHDTTADEDIEATVFQADETSSRPRWADDESRTGLVAVLQSETDVETFATRVVGSEERDDVDEELASWVRETDFEASVILGVQTVAPNACYETIEVTDLAVSTVEIPSERRAAETTADEEIGAITGAAAAVDDAGGDVGCAQVITYPTAYVRVTGEDLPSVAVLAITDGWGEETDVNSTDPLIDPATLPGSVRPDGEPPAVPTALVCDDEDFERLPSTAGGEVAWGETVDERGAAAFAMRADAFDEGDGTGDDGESGGDGVGSTNESGDGAGYGDSSDATDDLTFDRGDGVRISLWNVSTREQTTGNEHTYAVEVKTEDGWREVRGTDSQAAVGYTDERATHPPGGGFDWTVELTENGLVEERDTTRRLRVCPDLQTGRYRFRYWGLPDEASIAVAFDLAA
ncbi:hypothetical protein [Halovivax cerinus]|uniref:Uncharacterized protein n=1 Tax=Halovivax cerinus TaxID=1487865 RepID=A0ABD5NSU0_9EURY|nr:hypothetical protein [Halovivax cerinus]